MSNPFEGFDPVKLLPVVNALRGYHTHQVYGMENIPKEGPAILASNHSLATYDLIMLYGAIYEQTGRMVRPLMDRLFSKIPLLADFMHQIGARVGSQRTGRSLLKRGELLALAPGGMMEALRSSDHKYEINWNHRMGFIKLSINSGSPIILAACPKSDDLYDVYQNKITDLAYKFLKIPIPIAKGLGYTAIPKPVKLIHCISKPIQPPAKDSHHFKSQVREFHSQIMEKMKTLMEEALAKHEDDGDQGAID